MGISQLEVQAYLPLAADVIFHQPWPWVVFLASGILLLGLAGLLYSPTRLDLARRVRATLTALRMAALVLILVCLCRPAIRRVLSSEHDPNLVIAVDVSGSMSIEDHDGPTSRLGRFLHAFEESGLRSAFEERYVLRLFEFDSEAREVASLQGLRPKGDRTDLARSLEGLSQKAIDINTIGVVLVTDGADNSGERVLNAAEPFERRGVPLLPVGVGTEETEDLEIASVSTRRVVRINTTVEVKVKIRQSGYSHHLVPVVITRSKNEAGEGSAEVARKEIALKEETCTVDFEFTPVEEGLIRYAVEIPYQAGEVILHNNHRDFSVNSSRRKIRVLYMEGSQYRRADREFWEYQYLVQALLEDEDVEVTSLFRDEVEAAEEAGIGYISHPDKGFPRDHRDLFSYDVVISSDIDIELFTEGQLKNIVDFVGEYGGGLVMIGGWTSFGAGGYDESIIDQMLPVDMLGRKDRYTENVLFRWVLTPEAYDHPIMRLVADPAKNRLIWKTMPSFKGYNNVLRAKPAATVLAVHPTDSTDYGRRVMLAVHQYGKGRTMAFMPDTTAGWGELFEESFGEAGDNRYFRKFWKNAIRWLAAYRINVPNQLVTVQTSQSLYERGETARIEVNVLNSEYEPSRDAEVELEIKSPDGRASRRRLAADLTRDGVYPWQLPLNLSGAYHLVARARDAEGLIGEDRAEFQVQPATVEFRNYALNRSLLSAYAARTHGKYYDIDGIGDLAPDLSDATRKTVKTEVHDIWDHPLIYLFLLTVLAAEWALRKKQGLL